MLLYIALVRQDNLTKLGSLGDDFTDRRFVCKIKDGLGLKPRQPPFFAARKIIEFIRQMTLNVHDRSSEDLSKLILDCPVQTRCLSVSYERRSLWRMVIFSWDTLSLPLPSLHTNLVSMQTLHTRAWGLDPGAVDHKVQFIWWVWTQMWCAGAWFTIRAHVCFKRWSLARFLWTRARHTWSVWKQPCLGSHELRPRPACPNKEWSSRSIRPTITFKP